MFIFQYQMTIRFHFLVFSLEVTLSIAVREHSLTTIQILAIQSAYGLLGSLEVTFQLALYAYDAMYHLHQHFLNVHIYSKYLFE